MRFPILGLDSAVEIVMHRLMLEHVDQVVEGNEEVINGNSIHFASVEGSPGDQAPNMALSVHSDLHHLRDEVDTA